MTIESKLRELEAFAPFERLAAVTRLPVAYSPEAVVDMVPSFVIGSDGPTLARLLLVTKRFLCDVWLGDGREDFDYVPINTIKNYRFSLWTHVVKDQEVVKASYDIASIKFIHGDPEQFVTALDYAGQKRDEWMENLLRALPVTVLGSGGAG